MAELEVNETELNAVVMRRLETFTTAFVSRVATTAKQIAPERSGELKRLIRPDAVRRVGPWSLAPASPPWRSTPRRSTRARGLTSSARATPARSAS
jgi:hypothetical protein